MPGEQKGVLFNDKGKVVYSNLRKGSLASCFVLIAH